MLEVTPYYGRAKPTLVWIAKTIIIVIAIGG